MRTVVRREIGVTNMRSKIFGHIKLANVWMLRAGEEPPLAAHLITARRGYAHHGLYVGKGRVVHYPGLVGGVRGSAGEEISLEQFARGHAVGVRTNSTLRFEREDVVRRARSTLGEDRYHILHNNCEHFCEWCLSGVSRSPQVDSMLGGAGAVTAGMIEATAATTRSLLQLIRAIRVSRRQIAQSSAP
jgi:Lecithin retinol acyltransferase